MPGAQRGPRETCRQKIGNTMRACQRSKPFRQSGAECLSVITKASAPTARPTSVSSDAGKETHDVSVCPDQCLPFPPSPSYTPTFTTTTTTTTHLRCSSFHDDSLDPAIRMAAVDYGAQHRGLGLGAYHLPSVKSGKIGVRLQLRQ